MTPPFSPAARTPAAGFADSLKTANATPMPLSPLTPTRMTAANSTERLVVEPARLLLKRRTTADDDVHDVGNNKNNNSTEHTDDDVVVGIGAAGGRMDTATVNGEGERNGNDDKSTDAAVALDVGVVGWCVGTATTNGEHETNDSKDFAMVDGHKQQLVLAGGHGDNNGEGGKDIQEEDILTQEQQPWEPTWTKESLPGIHSDRIFAILHRDLYPLTVGNEAEAEFWAASSAIQQLELKIQRGM